MRRKKKRDYKLDRLSKQDVVEAMASSSNNNVTNAFKEFTKELLATGGNSVGTTGATAGGNVGGASTSSGPTTGVGNRGNSRGFRGRFFKNNQRHRPRNFSSTGGGNNGDAAMVSRASSGGGGGEPAGAVVAINQGKYSAQNKEKLFEEFCIRLDQMYDKYLVMRKRCFEVYHRVKESQRIKAEHEVHNCLRNIRKMENFLLKHYKGFLDKRAMPYRLDNLFSSLKREEKDRDQQRALPVTAPTVTAQPPSPGPLHLTTEQLARTSFKQDSEESIGTMMDYQMHRAAKKSK
ncbi:MAG: hypothetical protein HQK53_02005 [Oligoflexia bacterium]|nr:hypothetical protein [Oligoflexia bacterium]